MPHVLAVLGINIKVDGHARRNGNGVNIEATSTGVLGGAILKASSIGRIGCNIDHLFLPVGVGELVELAL